MADFLFWSDLHLEHQDFTIPTPDQLDRTVDGILIAGDTHVKGKHLDFFEAVWDIWRVPVLAVDGNHEPYRSKRIQKLWKLEDDRLAQMQAKGVDVEIMRGTSRVLAGTRIIGATLWTDMQLYPDRYVGAQHEAERCMNDYACIKILDEQRGIYRKLLARDTIAFHAADRSAIFRELARPFDGGTVVMTHHLPVKEMLDDKYLQSGALLSAAYASDMAPEIAKFDVDAWICGHSHFAKEWRLEGLSGTTDFLTNARGYPTEETGFDPLRVLHVPPSPVIESNPEEGLAQ